MKALLLQLVFLSSACALTTFYTPQFLQVHTLKVVRSHPNPSVYSRNWTLLIDPTSNFACDGATLNSTQIGGKFLFFVETACPGAVVERLNAWQPTGVAGFLYAGPAVTADMYAAYWFLSTPPAIPYNPSMAYDYSFPSFVFQRQFNATTSYENNPVVWTKVVGWLKNPNFTVTFRIEEEDYNFVINSPTILPSWGGFVTYFCQVLTTSVFVVLGIKWIQFFDFESGFKLSLPQIVFFFVAYSTLWAWMEALFGWVSVQSKLDHRFGTILLTWPQPPVLAACIVLAFYFREVSTITSGEIGCRLVVVIYSSFFLASSSLSFLDKFKIPTIVLVVSMFIVDWTLSGVVAARLKSLNIIDTFKIWAGFFAVYYAVTLGLLIWGGVALAMSLSSIGTNQKRATIVRILLLTGCLCILIVSLSAFCNSGGAKMCWGALTLYLQGSC